MSLTLPPNSGLANCVRKRRTELGITIQEIADGLHVSATVVQRLEMGPKRLPDPSLFHRLIKELDLDAETVLRAAGYLR